MYMWAGTVSLCMFSESPLERLLSSSTNQDFVSLQCRVLFDQMIWVCECTNIPRQGLCLGKERVRLNPASRRSIIPLLIQVRNFTPHSTRHYMSSDGYDIMDRDECINPCDKFFLFVYLPFFFTSKTVCTQISHCHFQSTMSIRLTASSASRRLLRPTMRVSTPLRTFGSTATRRAGKEDALRKFLFFTLPTWLTLYSCHD